MGFAKRPVGGDGGEVGAAARVGKQAEELVQTAFLERCGGG